VNAPLPLPTRRQEAWRYADLTALADLWPLAEAERIVVADGETANRSLVLDGQGVARLVFELGKGARASLHVVNAGPGYGRVEVTATLAEGADFTLGTAQLGGGEANREVIAEVIHAEPGATSRQVVRSVLAGHATGTCLGRIVVKEGAVGTDAEQSVRAMLLDRTATGNAKPELEIFADDVKCAHGCAIGELDAMGLFYLQSRGLDPASAKTLMLQAFIVEALAGAEDEDRLLAIALERLGDLV
jgi:Fe-S cluster assembly protein SufD